MLYFYAILLMLIMIKLKINSALGLVGIGK